MTENKKGAVIMVVNYDGNILLGKKKKSSLKFLAGEWHIPGENVEEGESDAEAIERGMREEAGLSVRVGRYIGKHTTKSGKEARWYECFSDSSDVKIGSDLEDFMWVKREKVPEYCGEKVRSLWSDEIRRYFR